MFKGDRLKRLLFPRRYRIVSPIDVLNESNDSLQFFPGFVSIYVLISEISRFIIKEVLPVFKKMKLEVSGQLYYKNLG
jgi:hypothetical protein